MFLHFLRRRLPLFSGALLILFAGCGGEKSVSESPRAVRGSSGGTMIVGMDADADALTPLMSSSAFAGDIAGQIFAGLAKTDPDMAGYSPWLAESWEFSNDRKELTFFLRRDAYWHDGVPFTAEDVAFSVPLYKSPEIAYGSMRWLRHITEVTAVDSYTVRFRFDAVYPYQLTDANVATPLPKHILGEVPINEIPTHPFHRNPVGTGPFKFVKWEPQQSIELEANESFFLGRPPLDRVVFKVVPSQTNLVTQLRTGDIDFYPKLRPEAYEDLQDVDHLRKLQIPSRVYYYLGWQNASPFFSDRNVRRALTMAIDRESIVKNLVKGRGAILNTPILPFLWAHDPEVPAIPYDPEGAKKLLSEAGWADHDGDGWLDRNGTPFEFTMKTNENNDLRKDIVVVVQEMLAKLGIRMRPETMEFTVFIDQTTGKDFESMCHGWKQGSKVDLTSIWHTQSINDRYNMVSYSNPRVDELMDRAVTEIDREKATKLWSEVQRLIAADAAYTFLFTLDDLYAIDDRFQNVELTTYSWTYNMHEWSVDPARRKY
ncbi:MAG: hypothetical protein HKN20_13405 [Gemmatimonadetes bacterium]|nr:hypothetical protein [Gemmatimonadota bacterium]